MISENTKRILSPLYSEIGSLLLQVPPIQVTSIHTSNTPTHKQRQTQTQRGKTRRVSRRITTRPIATSPTLVSAQATALVLYCGYYEKASRAFKNQLESKYTEHQIPIAKYTSGSDEQLVSLDIPGAFYAHMDISIPENPERNSVRRVFHVCIWFVKKVSAKLLARIYGKIYTWLLFSSKRATSCRKGSTDVAITIIMSPHKKQLPKGREILDVINCNSAFTYACSSHSPSNSIFIFRREEWFKVLVHETMHCLGLDFSSLSVTASPNNRIRELFPGTSNVSDYKITELYVEMWADIINVGFTGESIRDVWRLLEREQSFSRLQATKILDYYRLSYDKLMTPLVSGSISTVGYSEKVAVFSYYIGRALVLSEMDSFLRFCEKNNRPNLIQFTNHPNVDSRLEFVEQVIAPGIKYYQQNKQLFAFKQNTNTNLRMTSIDDIY